MSNAINLTEIGEMIAAAGPSAQTTESIRNIHQNPQGAEWLRLIVRDNLGGAGDIIANALWDGL